MRPPPPAPEPAPEERPRTSVDSLEPTQVFTGDEVGKELLRGTTIREAAPAPLPPRPLKQSERPPTKKEGSR
jgi:hypothetical protein